MEKSIVTTHQSPAPLSPRITLGKTLLTTSILVTLFLSFFYLLPPRAIVHLNTKTMDILLGALKAPEQQKDIILIDIDEASLNTHGQWPWSRRLFAQLLQKINAGKPASIGIDVLFPEKDRSSPKTWQEALKKDFGYHLETDALPEDLLDNDLLLANTLANGPFTLGFEFLFGKNRDKKAVCPIAPITLTKVTRGGATSQSIQFHQADSVLCSYLPLTNAAPGAGFLNGAPDSDGILRRLPVLMQYEGRLYPSFALAVLLRMQDRRTLSLLTDVSFHHRLALGEHPVPIDVYGNILLGPPGTTRPLLFSAKDVLDEKFTPDQLQNALVFVGATAAGLARGYPTPFAPAGSLLDLHAAAISALTAKVPLYRPPVTNLLEVVASLLLVLWLAIVTTRRTICFSIIFSLILISSIWLAAMLLLHYSGLLCSPFLPTIALIINFFLLVTLKFRYFQAEAKSETGNTLLLLKRSESSLQSILHTVPDIIFRLDNAGNIVFISPAISKYTKSPDEMLGTPIFQYVAPEDQDKALYRLNERRTGGRATFDLEVRLLLTRQDQHQDESFRFFSVSAEGLYQQDGPKFLGTQGIVKDITERKKLESQLIQAQKMEVIGNLAAGIAHDLNNILSGLVSYPDLLLLEIPKDDPLHDKISTIKKSGQKAAVIVQDLLTLARRNVAVPTICNLNQILREYLNSVEFKRLHARYPNITISTDPEPMLLNVHGSAFHLSKIFMNLLINGMEAMPAGGKMTIKTANVLLASGLDGFEYIPPGEYVFASVEDNGIGIAPSVLPHIFEPFFTKKATGSSGTGLGMTIVWVTVKDHFGYLDVWSKEGQGTTLTFYLPATKATFLPPPRVLLEDLVGSGTVLIVDDIAEQRSITASMLAKLGYTVRAAASGEEAVALCAKDSPDLLVLDMIMPDGIDGLETYRQIRQVVPQQRGIVTSGFSESERVKELHRLGVTVYVQKPFTMEQIGMAVKKAMREESATSLPHSSR